MTEISDVNSSHGVARFFFRIFIGLIVLLILAGGGLLLYQNFFNNSTAAETSGVIFDVVKRGNFLHEVTSRGNVESAQNEDIRCQVESPSGTLVIWIIPEGTIVKQGDVLCQLDSSNLLDKVAQQKITVSNNYATFQQSQADYETAKLALQEYQEGTFIQEKKSIENRILKAQEDLSRATDVRDYTEKLLAQGYQTEMQLKADIAKETQTKNDLDIAKLELKVLEDYTKAKMEMQLKAAISTTETKMESDKQQWNIAKDRSEYYQTQLENCTIKATKEGQVVYATPTSPWRRDNEIIKEGNSVRERQAIIRLPDPRQMQVSGMINEASVSHVKVGQLATITLEAMPNRVFHGEVKMVNDYPEPDSPMGAMVREYKTIVTIDDLGTLPSEQRSAIRPGLTAQLKIDVTRASDEATPLLVPVQSLFEHQGTYYCITCDNGKWEKIPVEVGDTNDTEVVIKSGIEEGRQIVQGARIYASKVLSDEEVKNARDFGIGGARSGRGGEGRTRGGNINGGNRPEGSRSEGNAPNTFPPRGESGGNNGGENSGQPPAIPNNAANEFAEQQTNPQLTDLEKPSFEPPDFEKPNRDVPNEAERPTDQPPPRFDRPDRGDNPPRRGTAENFPPSGL
ncbi:MAG: biotin/lipoyl-binding protein [Planctomycetaceae bacterium]|jgi:HlyD family secretion protein|nr:biotin/lipoyl-binding protein [Planctomycetaceae bacterium]